MLNLFTLNAIRYNKYKFTKKLKRLQANTTLIRSEKLYLGQISGDIKNQLIFDINKNKPHANTHLFKEKKINKIKLL